MSTKIIAIQKHVEALEKDFALKKCPEIIEKFIIILFTQINYVLETNINTEDTKTLKELKQRVYTIDLLNKNKFTKAVIKAEEDFNKLLKETNNLRQQLAIIKSSQHNPQLDIDIDQLKDKIENIYFSINQNEYVIDLLNADEKVE